VRLSNEKQERMAEMAGFAPLRSVRTTGVNRSAMVISGEPKSPRDLHVDQKMSHEMAS
jgi:hypothetical protein